MHCTLLKSVSSHYTYKHGSDRHVMPEEFPDLPDHKYSKFAKMFNRFFRYGLMRSTYKPIFLRALTDLGRYGETDLVGREWVELQGDKILLDLDFIAVRLAKYYWDMEFGFHMRHTFGASSGDNIMISLIQKAGPKLEKEGIIAAGKSPTLEHLASAELGEFRHRVVVDAMKSVLDALPTDMPDLYTREGRNRILLDHEIIGFMREFAPVIKKALNCVIAKHLEKLNPSARSIASRIDGEEEPNAIASYDYADVGKKPAELDYYAEVLQRKGQMIFYGPPGTGKTYTARQLADHLVRSMNPRTIEPNDTSDDQHEDAQYGTFIRMVTFHQSYSYEDFVEGIRPTVQNGQISYVVNDGLFKRLAADAAADPSNMYVLLIDEINRGNISKIFGELITLIEKDKRGGQPLRLAYSQDDFAVPENLFIIGTMNTADRSLVQIDAALRRRFAFVELMPQPDLLEDRAVGRIPLQGLLAGLNQRLAKEGMREMQIGHSYFMDVDTPEDLRFVFLHEIIPLLKDYFFDEAEKLSNRILGRDLVDDNVTARPELQTDIKKFLDVLKSFPA